MVDPNADDDLDPVLDRVLEKFIRRALRRFQETNSLSSADALNLILEEYFVEYPLGDDVPNQEGGADSTVPEKKVNPILGCPVSTAIAIAGTFGTGALFYAGFFWFFHWLNGLRIPEEAWLRFAALGSEHLMYVPILFPAITLGAGVTWLIMTLFDPNRPKGGGNPGRDSRGQEMGMIVIWIIVTSILAFPFAFFGADGYGWVDDDGIHINPVGGLGKTEEYDWDHITHVHTQIEPDGDRNVKSEFRVIFFDGRTQNLKEGVRNQFLDVHERIGSKLETVGHLDVSQRFHAVALQRLRERDDQEYAKRLVDALNVARQPIPGLWP